MKLITMTLMMLLLSGTAIAKETKTTSTESAVQAITGKEPKSRKKKVQMCAECGKPESECECEGHKEESTGKAEKHDDHSH